MSNKPITTHEMFVAPKSVLGESFFVYPANVGTSIQATLALLLAEGVICDHLKPRNICPFCKSFRSPFARYKPGM